MTTVTVYDPAMCCATGICGTEVDQRLVDLAADLDWLKARGVRVRRYGLSREPAEFAANETIRRIMQESEGDDLPVFLVDGVLKARARYPSRRELAAWTGLAVPAPAISDEVRALIALGAAIAAGCEPCLRQNARQAAKLGLTDAQMREAVAIGRMVAEASAQAVHDLAGRLIPAPAAASGCCAGEARPAPAAASGCCGGGRAEPSGEAARGGS